MMCQFDIFQLTCNIFISSIPIYFRVVAETNTAKNEDFIAKTVDVTFQPGEKGPKSVVFDIVDDPLVESTEYFDVSFASSTSSAVKFGESSVINIIDNDGKLFQIIQIIRQFLALA